VDLPFVRKHLTQLVVGFTSDRLSNIITGVRALESEARDDRDASAEAAVQALLYAANLELGADKPAEGRHSATSRVGKDLKTSPTSVRDRLPLRAAPAAADASSLSG
jgi:hypothetical protein